MQFKSGLGWKACYDKDRGLFTASTWGAGTTTLWEITAEVWSAIRPGVTSDAEAEELIRTGRSLYMDVNDRCGPHYTVVLDSNYEKLCPWANVKPGGHVWSEELTDAAVELFASQENNREQRRRKRAEREKEQSESGKKSGPRKKGSGRQKDGHG